MCTMSVQKALSAPFCLQFYSEVVVPKAILKFLPQDKTKFSR